MQILTIRLRHCYNGIHKITISECFTAIIPRFTEFLNRFANSGVKACIFSVTFVLL